MEDEALQQLMASAERLATAAEALDRVVTKLDGQQESLNAKIDRIVAAVDDRPAPIRESGPSTQKLQERIAELERVNLELSGQAGRLARKTLPPLVSALLSKNFAENEQVDNAALDKALSSLSIEQRIAVKAEMARAGMLM
jgi:ABC-type transporter Mla subunit MlaD